MPMQLPEQLSEVAPFIESDVQISKETLIHRCAGKVSYQIFTFLKLFVFRWAYKDHEGKVYFD
jgi:hypothetical protein